MNAARIAIALAVALFGIGAHGAESYPSHPIRLVVGLVPGGSEDAMARIVATEMSKVLGQSIIVENKPGAGGTIAYTQVAQAKPDGYTLVIGQANLHSAMNFTYPNLQFNGAKDFTPIGSISRGILVVVANKDMPASNLKDLMTYARTSKKHLFYATSGQGRVTEYAGVGFQHATGLDMEPVAYKGGGETVVSVAAGETQLAFATVPSVVGMLKSGQLKALGVTSAQRFSLLPDVPGAAEGGIPNYDVSYWLGIFGPANLPADVRQKLFAALDKTLSLDSVRSQIIKQGMEPMQAQSQKAFAELYEDDGRKTLELVRLSAQK